MASLSLQYSNYYVIADVRSCVVTTQARRVRRPIEIEFHDVCRGSGAPIQHSILSSYVGGLLGTAKPSRRFKPGTRIGTRGGGITVPLTQRTRKNRHPRKWR